MILKKFLIAGGNSTLLVWENSLADKNEIIRKYLGDVEQIGFVNGKSLEMMGGELCINATLAFASTLSENGWLLTSGTLEPVEYSNKEKAVSISISLPYIQNKNVILFDGIGYILLKAGQPTKKLLSSLAEIYKKPAFGVIIYQENKINPFVYVTGTNSLVPETACGSGSIAFSISSGYKKVIHPTGQSILVRQRGSKFTVTAKVDKIGTYD